MASLSITSALLLLCCLVIQAHIDSLWDNPPIAKFAQNAEKLGLYYGLNLHEHIRSSSSSTPRPFSREERLAAKTRKTEFEKIGREVEDWAEAMLAESGRDGSFVLPGTNWTKVDCNKALKRVLNPNSKTLQYVKWLPDSRGTHADASSKLHPCMKVYAEIDAPFDLVCRYLSQEQRYKEYNSLLIDQKDVEELTPSSKICWSQTKKLLFIQPRDFVTYCAHKWRKDGSEVILNQACNHPTFQTSELRAFGLRGATFLSRHPEQPDKTSIILLSHCNCGNDIPEWAVRTAVGVLAPIKPFEIIHRINIGVKKAENEVKALEDTAQKNKKYLKPREDGRSRRPAGMAQMGYACFWPKGGGLMEEE
mmetsp:Transcript_50928/g.99643  ORF Transcript_50928/g.99643 Transcript_50928/m.99643 type:complete len:364 (+) Transcript_50928:65-1156(+)